MSKSSKDQNGKLEEKPSKNKLSTNSGKKTAQDFQSKDRNIENSETIKSCSKEKMIKKGIKKDDKFNSYILKEMVNSEGSIDSLRISKICADSVCNVDDLSSEDLHDSLYRISKNPAEPFKFLSHILDDIDTENYTCLGKTKPTDIDLQLASLVKRVEMNKSLLERTNQRVKDINFIVEKNKILASKELDYDKDSLLKMGDSVEYKTEKNIEHPGIDALQRTMKDTLQMLECIKQVASGDANDELSSEFFSKIELGSISSNLGKIESNWDLKSGLY